MKFVLVVFVLLNGQVPAMQKSVEPMTLQECAREAKRLIDAGVVETASCEPAGKDI